MLIDWFTVGSQIVNFLVLVWLLKRLLYQPILGAMAERERRIAATLADAAEKKAAAEKELALFRARNENFDREKEGMLKQAGEEAERKRGDLVNAARQEAQALQTKWHEALAREKEALGKELQGHVQKEVFAIARQALEDLAGTKLEERMAGVFIQRLSELDPVEKERVAALMQDSMIASVLVRSAFELPASARNDIATVVRRELSAVAELHFEVAPRLVSGIELVTAGYKLSWTIGEYLASLEKGLEEAVEKEEKADALGG